MQAHATLTILGLVQREDPKLSDQDREQLLSYSQSATVRKNALLDIKKIELQAATYCVENVHRRYPRFNRFHPLGKEKGIRDMQLLLGACAKCMFLNDTQYLNDHVLIWVRTIFRSLNFTPGFMQDTGTLLKEGVKKFAQPATFILIEPLLRHMTMFLSDIPEPIVVEV